MRDVLVTTIQVRQRGTLTLPAEFRAKYNIKPGDTFQVIDLDGILILTPMTPMVPELARELGDEPKTAALSSGLKTQQRARRGGRQRQNAR